MKRGFLCVILLLALADLTWNTIDGGGTTLSTGGSYTLNGGFWGGASINYNIHLPLALKNI